MCVTARFLHAMRVGPRLGQLGGASSRTHGPEPVREQDDEERHANSHLDFSAQMTVLRHPPGDCIGDPFLALKLPGIQRHRPVGTPPKPPSRVPQDRYSWPPAMVTGKKVLTVR